VISYGHRHPTNSKLCVFFLVNTIKNPPKTFWLRAETNEL
jgi:hypothetical protein